MSTYKNVIKGLELLASCEKHGQDAYGVDAEHDQIYAGPDISEVPEGIKKQLEALGWFESDADRFSIYT